MFINHQYETLYNIIHKVYQSEFSYIIVSYKFHIKMKFVEDFFVTKVFFGMKFTITALNSYLVGLNWANLLRL